MAEVTHHDRVEHATEHAHDDHAHSDTVVILGREITVEGGIYTVIFGGLAILTILEVLIAEIFKGAITATPGGDSAVVVLQFLPALKAFLLLGIGIIKSTLVILFYMHLKDENRLLAIVILLPLLIATLSILFVLAVPPSGYTL